MVKRMCPSVTASVAFVSLTRFVQKQDKSCAAPGDSFSCWRGQRQLTHDIGMYYNLYFNEAARAPHDSQMERWRYP